MCNPNPNMLTVALLATSGSVRPYIGLLKDLCGPIFPRTQAWGGLTVVYVTADDRSHLAIMRKVVLAYRSGAHDQQTIVLDTPVMGLDEHIELENDSFDPCDDSMHKY